jgi:hypothetical protein
METNDTFINKNDRDPGREAKVQINGLLLFCCPIKQTNKLKNGDLFFSNISLWAAAIAQAQYRREHSGTIVPFLAELSQTPNKFRAFFPTVTSHTHTNILTDIFEFMTHYDGNMGKSKKFT